MKKDTIDFLEIVMLARDAEIEKAISYFEKAADARSEGSETFADLCRGFAERAEAKAQKLNEVLGKLVKGEIYNERY